MPDDLRPISIVGASAGTGKTYRLASDFANELHMQSGVSASQMIATTFTNKAADELAERIRMMLLRSGRWEDAQAVLAGFVGTVNSICGRLVSELVINAGLSPSVNVIAEDRQSEVFAIAVENVTNSYASELWPITTRLSKDDWRDDVRKIAEMARQNNVAPEQLKSFADDSWLRYQRLLPVADTPEEAAAIASALRVQLSKSIGQLEAGSDNTSTTAGALTTLREAQREVTMPQELPWKTWAKVGKIRTAKASQTAVAPLAEIGLAHLRHPDFQRDIGALTSSVFNCAADCLSLYQDFKSERGLIDFVDQEQIALSILKDPAVRDSLGGRFHKLFVDEFQDTSPIQLAVFLELAKIVQSSTWVGDEKQSIFGFRGADPELMQEVIQRLVPLSGGGRDSLKTSYRSRPSLVSFVNNVFAESMHTIGIDAAGVQITDVHRSDLPQLNHPLHVWWLQASNLEESMEALAGGIREVLDNREGWQVSKHNSIDTRAIVGSDIAVLCRTNGRRLALSDALAKAGISTATQRSGLLDRPECVLSAAVLRYLVDPYDTLAMAEILRLTSAPEEETAWLSGWIEKGQEDLRRSAGCLVELDALRTQLVGMTPVEAIELATSAPFVLSTIKSWGKPRQRLLNIDALRGLAISYEELCLTRRGAATPAGFITFLYTEVSDAVQPANPDEDAVQVLTYHKAKGLEWPFVIMFDLDSPPPATPFGVFVENAAAGFDPLRPLADRLIRYWPWPYGQQRANLDLITAATQSPEMNSAVRRHAGKHLRLLYVGMTRPRDYLVLACRPATSGTGWLNTIHDADGGQLFNLPVEAGLKPILASMDDITACFSILKAPDDVTGKADQPDRIVYEQPGLSASTLPAKRYSTTPSSEHGDQAGRIDSKEHIGDRLDFSKAIDIRLLGEALHRFLAADDFQATGEARLRNAARAAESWGISGLSPEQFVEASNRLKRKLDKLFPGAVWMKEWPVAGRLAGQRMKGTIDLLLELADGFVIVDHKSFPGPYELWEKQAAGHYPQLDAYAKLVEQATGKPAAHLYIHMPIVGSLLKISGTPL